MDSDGPTFDTSRRPAGHHANCGVGVVADLETGPNHAVVSDSLTLLANLEHRGTTGAEADTGDGAGIMLRIPRDFFGDVVPRELPETYAVGTMFFPQDEMARRACMDHVESRLEDYGLDVIYWRDVPTNNNCIGETARETEPAIYQCFVTAADTQSTEEFDCVLYVARRAIETSIDDALDGVAGTDQFYICSLDRQTVVYKGLLTGPQLSDYYSDLIDDRVRSTFAIVHARFSTNTLGAWHLAHPYRSIVHNGEFNTLQGNINWMRAREAALESDRFGDELETVLPVIDDPEQSDTATVDNTIEFLLEDGRSLPHALRMIIPEAWRDDDHMESDRQAWYDYHASVMEPWDGPALVVGTDGDRIGAVLDRNGLRPCRYDVTEDGRVVMASEVGALEHDPAKIKQRDRLEPGQLFLADPEEGRILDEDDVFEELVDEKYGQWADTQQETLSEGTGPLVPDEPSGDLRAHQAAHGYTYDELENLLEPMAEDGKDPIGSMGNDTPLSVMSDFNRPLPSYFKQRFAQVTNPAIDHIREEEITTLETRLGPQRNLLDESPAHADQMVLDSPILSSPQFRSLRDDQNSSLQTGTIDITYERGADLESAIETVRRETARAVQNEVDIVILSDRNTCSDRVPIPALLATGAVHHHLVREGLRSKTGLVVDSGDPRTVHQVATVVGYGAGAVHPYLAYRTIEDAVAGPDGADTGEAIHSYVTALEDGILKTMSKMGISTFQSYQGAQVFETVGLDTAVVDEYFTGTPARTEGVGIEQIGSDLRERHDAGFHDDSDDGPDMDRQGEYDHKSYGVHHQWNPRTVSRLQEAVRENDYETYRLYAAETNDQTMELQTLRGLLEFDSERDSIPLEDVEPVEDIVQRFSTAPMSLGSISPEAHETNAIAMNRLGAKSNTGEGGEPPERFGTDRECNVKQVASGRFGVTSAYLSSAEEIQIKIAQGSKPGEGGHLPGKKVNEMIANVRYTVPGVDLISPPPQHDIYSIEDLKQLIYDLKSANPDADVNVKLVAEAGIGTIAAGVAQANADTIHVSGHSGGTGASPKTSIKNAGVPWELGLTEANRLLHETGLRDRVRLSVDGGLKTGRDVAVAALLGAEEYVFGTASLISSGCVMARICHTNNCPTGVATQKPELRERFDGHPEYSINYFTFIAEELRELMAELGFSTIDEMVGRVDVLSQRTDVDHPKARTLDLSYVLEEPDGRDGIVGRKTEEQDHRVDSHFDHELLNDIQPALENEKPVSLETTVTNEDRAVGALLSHTASEQYGEGGFDGDPVEITLRGSPGQSFGAFLISGITLDLVGSANDYVGKGLSGGRICVRPSANAGYDASENISVGNVALYGATRGELYVNGRAGERFAVRNSGVRAVVEGVGDHACEYMTGGIVVVLGSTGTNFAAGMSGGIAYVYDPDQTVEQKINSQMVTVSRGGTELDERVAKQLIKRHATYTESDRATTLLDDWETVKQDLVTVVPDPYRETITDKPEKDVRRTFLQTNDGYAPTMDSD